MCYIILIAIYIMILINKKKNYVLHETSKHTRIIKNQNYRGGEINEKQGRHNV